MRIVNTTITPLLATICWAGDMLIEMITPKIKEFKGNFSQSKRPSQDDVNHLDSKLNKIM
ncbi:hypothetical protein [uncultured Gammaproteobacteria bacterium]|jgi:hypothetical protein|nr:hypothetical protein [uncultured Gammaproteobacteria bacterium]CAC9546657.1 hypothetical protein [uncultured Gammaproteobacteria bacterium]CAC9555292.1 hypothetical protein [uncultured Gammaproteobacteria bacterium]CAC9567043.1 hypothetical protein [uncultured Gammaproteobacteria bacterium]CAC9584725.1 hypothetical protein [uncultured Gammaproteobacteria bacterium]